MYLNQYDHKTAPSVAKGSPLRQDQMALTAFNVLTEARCDYCHVEKVELPFYFKFPVANQLMQKDRMNALRNFRMEPVIDAMTEGKTVDSYSLARIEFVMQRDLMPPSSYLLMHWHSRLSADQRNAVIEWIKRERKDHYAVNGVAGQFVSDPVQPIPESLPVDEKQVLLGKRLFFDKRLSDDNTMNCASCHNLSTGGVVRTVTATGIHGQIGPINIPTVYNAAFNHVQFWDGRAKDLEEQAGGPVMNPIEMGSKSWEEVVEKLKQDPSYEQEFKDVYDSPVMDQKTITDAIAAYEKTLITPDSPFDMYLKGINGAISTQAKHGYQLFKDIGCASCHNGPSLGGQAYARMGLQGDYFKDRGGIVTDADLGHYHVTHNELDKYTFKIPNLRNIELTAPYFHDGSVKTLKEAVEKMVKYQTPYHDLSDQDVNDIVMFLQSLTGKYQGQSLDKISENP